MKTAFILLSILGMACAFSMKNLYRRLKLEDSEENGVFKYRPRYYLYKHAYFYPPLKRFPVQGGSDSSEENGDGDSSEEGEEEEENSNEEENNEDSNGNEDENSAAENTTMTATPGYGEEATPGMGNMGLAAIRLPKKAAAVDNKAAKKKESDEEEEEEEEEENEEAEVDENEQSVNGTSTNSTEVDTGNGSSGGDNGEAEEESVTGGTAAASPLTSGRSKSTPSPDEFQPSTPPPQPYGTTPSLFATATTAEYGAEYEQTGNHEYDQGYEVYDTENGEPRGDNYRAYEDEYSYYKGRGYDAQDYYYPQ